MTAQRSHWLQWYKLANAFHNKVSFKSYADVLKSGKHFSSQQQHQVLCTRVDHKVQKPRVLYTNKSSTGQKTKTFVQASGPLKEKEKSISLTNRFQILQHEDLQAPVITPAANSPVAAANTLFFAANKNENGQKLGQAAKVEHLTKHFTGNKNKTGKTLGHNTTATYMANNDKDNVATAQLLEPMVNGDDTQGSYPIQSPHEHGNISSRGNKNGNGQILGAMNIGEGATHPDGASSSSLLDLEPCDIVGDTPNITKHRKKNIPETVQWERVH